MTQSIHEFASQASRAPEEKQKKDERATVWVFVWTLFVFKIVTVGAILWASGGTGEARALMVATTWIYVALPIFVLAAPVALFFRRRRVRRKREALRRAEWMLDGGESGDRANFHLAPTAASADNAFGNIGG